ncbi:MAG: GIY-YIG nuclease family protein [Candidatus Levyibacteriota bacterium]
MYFLYILQSTLDKSFYIGSTSSIEQRLKKHNSGGSKYTKSRKPWEVVYKEEYNSLSEARKRETYLKSLKSRKAIEKLINGPIV